MNKTIIAMLMASLMLVCCAVGSVTANADLIESIDISPSNPVVGETVTFTAILKIPEENVRNCLWDFGDGEQSEGLIATHTYSKAGEYYVMFFVLAWTGESDRVTVQLTVSINEHNNPPTTPICSYDKENNKIIASSNDIDGDKIRYGVSWDNDGNVDQWTGYHDSGDGAEINCGDHKGTIGVIAEDEYGAQSSWASISIKVISYPTSVKLLDLFPNAVLVLRFLPKL